MNVPGHPIGSESQPKENKQRARRRFIHGVGVAVPVIMTVKSSSALAAQCFAPSAAASIALLHSRLDREQLSCTGHTPMYWQTNHNEFSSDNPLFSSIFSGGFADKTLLQVIRLPDAQDLGLLGRYLSAAYINHQKGLVPDTVLSIQDLQDMWTGRSGTYTPTAGVTWDGDAIVAYLKTTMPP